MMELKTAEEWGTIYREKYAFYENYTNKLDGLISDLLIRNNIDVQIEHRTKNVNNFIEKIRREGKDYKNPLEEVTDLVGIRIICFYLEDVDPIGNIIKDEFEIDWNNSIDKGQTLDPDKFGYLSVHYIIKLGNNRKYLTEWKDYSSIKVEIQLRTVLQHAWAAIDHKLRYKTAKEVPNQLKRKLFRLSALLELADDEFSDLRRLTEQVEDHYSNELQKGELNVDIDLLSLEAYINSMGISQKWLNLAKDAGFELFGIEVTDNELFKFNQSLLINVLNKLEIKTIREFDGLLNDKPDQIQKVLQCFRETYYKKVGSFPIGFYESISFYILYKCRNKLDYDKIEDIGFSKDRAEIILEVVSNLGLQ